ncbi:MAG: ABC transporter substrate-binding protein [Gemmatimonadota bacterium]
MSRVVSLIASSTEIVYALGQGVRLVARSHECDHPPEVRDLPAVTEPRFPTDGTSYEIDQRVRALVQEALSVYRVDAERLRAVRPDVIVTQTQCEVCAVSLRDVEEALAEWTGARPILVSLSPDSLGAVWEDIRRVAVALGGVAVGGRVGTGLRLRASESEAAAAPLPHRPTVACVEWIDPLMAAGNWMPELVVMAGGRNLVGEAGRHSPVLEWEQLRILDPDVLFVSPCGFDLARTRADMEGLASRPGWDELRAVREGRVALADGVQWFNRPGPRLVESLEILAEILHPERFDFGYRERAWEPWTADPDRA